MEHSTVVIILLLTIQMCIDVCVYIGPICVPLFSSGNCHSEIYSCNS